MPRSNSLALGQRLDVYASTLFSFSARDRRLCACCRSSSRTDTSCHCLSQASNASWLPLCDCSLAMGPLRSGWGRHSSNGQKRDCRGCLLKVQCCPKTSVRKIPRSIYEEARDVARALARTEAIIPRQELCRNAVCALEAHFAARPAAIARAMRCPVRVHVGSDCAEPPQACQVSRPATTVRPFARCLSVASVSKVERKSPAQFSG